jgi:hypothetical protein
MFWSQCLRAMLAREKPQPPIGCTHLLWMWRIGSQGSEMPKTRGHLKHTHCCVHVHGNSKLWHLVSMQSTETYPSRYNLDFDLAPEQSQQNISPPNTHQQLPLQQCWHPRSKKRSMLAAILGLTQLPRSVQFLDPSMSHLCLSSRSLGSQDAITPSETCPCPTHHTITSDQSIPISELWTTCICGPHSGVWSASWQPSPLDQKPRAKTSLKLTA